jgi:hypothetical protein
MTPSPNNPKWGDLPYNTPQNWQVSDSIVCYKISMIIILTATTYYIWYMNRHRVVPSPLALLYTVYVSLPNVS